MLILSAIILSVFHRQSLDVTPFEWALGGFLALLCVWAAVRLLHAGLRIRTALFWFLLFAVWSIFNVVFAMVEGVPPATWGRFAFPAFLLPAIGVLSTFELNTYARMRAGYLSLMLLGVGVVAVSLFHLAYVSIADVVDLQVLRRYGGDYFSTFSLCLTLPLVLDGSPRKRIVKIGLWLCLVLSVLGVLFSFTRTYWISTTISLAFLLHLMARSDPRGARFRIWRLFVAGGAVAIGLFIMLPANVKRFTALRAVEAIEAVQATSFRERVAESQAVVHRIVESPTSLALGHGYGATFTYTFYHPVTGQLLGGAPTQYSHNYYAYLTFTTGLVGLALFLLGWLAVLRGASTYLAKLEGSRALASLIVGACTAVFNLLITCLAAPQLMNFNWTLYFGVLIGVAANLGAYAQASALAHRPAPLHAAPRE